MSSSSAHAIEIVDMPDDQNIRFRLKQCDTSVANALRRVIIAEVQTLAIDLVEISENTTVLFDEYLAHRIGLIPLQSTKQELASLIAPDACTCQTRCQNCSVRYHLDVTFDGFVDGEPVDRLEVTSKHLVQDEAESVIEAPPVVEDPALARTEDTQHGISIVRLSPGQRIAFTAYARLGTGKEHAKWSPVSTVAYQFQPVVRINEAKMDELEQAQREELVASCPARVYTLDPITQRVELTPEDVQRCMYCDECVTVANSFKETEEEDAVVDVSALQNEFIFSVESTGALPATDIVEAALSVLKDKLETVSGFLSAMEPDG